MRHQVRDHGLIGGKPDGTGRSSEEGEQHQHPWGIMPDGGQRGQDGGEGHLGQGGDDQPPATVEPIGQRPTQRGQQPDGDEPGRRHQTGPGRLTSAGEDQDSEGDRLHPRADVRHQCSRPDQRKVPRPERAKRCQGHSGEVTGPVPAHRRGRSPRTGPRSATRRPCACALASGRTTRCWPWWPARPRRPPVSRSYGSDQTWNDVTRPTPSAVSPHRAPGAARPPALPNPRRERPAPPAGRG